MDHESQSRQVLAELEWSLAELLGFRWAVRGLNLKHWALRLEALVLILASLASSTTVETIVSRLVDVGIRIG